MGSPCGAGVALRAASVMSAQVCLGCDPGGLPPGRTSLKVTLDVHMWPAGPVLWAAVAVRARTCRAPRVAPACASSSSSLPLTLSHLPRGKHRKGPGKGVQPPGQPVRWGRGSRQAAAAPGWGWGFRVTPSCGGGCRKGAGVSAVSVEQTPLPLGHLVGPGPLSSLHLLSSLRM